VHVRPNTIHLYGQHLRNHIAPVFGRRQLGSIQRADVTSFVAALNDQLAPATTSTVYAVLRSLMQAAVDDNVIPVNPRSRIQLPRIEQRALAPLPVDAVLRLIDAMPDHLKVAVWLGAGAGLREGETLGLLASRVDFLRRRIHVDEQLVSVNGEPPHLAPTQNESIPPCRPDR
jgi:integrase